MFITDKLTEFAIAICNEFVALGLGLPPPFDVASSEALECCFILLFLHFFRFLLCFCFSSVAKAWPRWFALQVHLCWQAAMRQNNYRATAYLSDVRRGNIGGRERPAFGTFAFFFSPLFTFDFTHNFHGKVHSRRAASEITFKNVGPQIYRLRYRLQLQMQIQIHLHSML